MVSDLFDLVCIQANYEKNNVGQGEVSSYKNVTNCLKFGFGVFWDITAKQR